MNNKITYHKVGDYYLPNLYLAKDEYEKYYQMNNYKHSVEEIIFEELIYI